MLTPGRIECKLSANELSWLLIHINAVERCRTLACLRERDYNALAKSGSDQRGTRTRNLQIRSLTRYPLRQPVLPVSCDVCATSEREITMLYGTYGYLYKMQSVARRRGKDHRRGATLNILLSLTRMYFALSLSLYHEVPIGLDVEQKLCYEQ